MKKLLYVLPVVFLLMVMSCMAVTWTCPVSGSGTASSPKSYAEYSDSGEYSKCTSGGNNFTIEFSIDGSDFAAVGDGAGTYANATLYVMRGNDNKFVLPLSSNFTNGTMIRWTDFGELYTTGSVGQPKWYNNLTEDSYKWYVRLDNNTDAGSSDQLLSTTTGFAAGYAVPFTIDLEKTPGQRLAGAVASGAEVSAEAQALFGGVAGAGGKIPKNVIIGFFIVVIYLIAFRKK